MDQKELISALKELMRTGFDSSFASFCAKTFSSHRYPPGNLAAARMHAFYLRMALEVLTDSSTREELFAAEAKGLTRNEEAFRLVTIESFQAALSSVRPFAELFVEKWCAVWAGADEGAN